MTDRPEIPRELVESIASNLPQKTLGKPGAEAIAESVIRAMLERVTLGWVEDAPMNWLIGKPNSVGRLYVIDLGDFMWWLDGETDQYGDDVPARQAESIEAAKSAALAHYRAAWLAAMEGKAK